jgi:methionine-rich copper-binding protein CopC
MKSRFALALMCLALLPVPAFAHAHLAEATPADGSVLTAPPTHFLLKFSEEAHLTALSLRREGETRTQKIAPLPAAASKTFSVAAPQLKPGAYHLDYRVVASDDNHLSTGTIRFRLSIAP